MRRVKPLQPQPLRRHFIEHRRIHMRMSVVARLLPAMIIPHHEDDIRLRPSGEQRAKSEEDERGGELHGGMKRDRGRLPAGKKACLAATERMRYSRSMNWHQVIDERSYEMDQVIADILRQSPEKLSLVTAWIEARMSDPRYSIHSKDALQEWSQIIDHEGVDGVLKMLSEQSDEADRMRQSSPLGILMPKDQRAAILKKYAPHRTRASLAGV